MTNALILIVIVGIIVLLINYMLRSQRQNPSDSSPRPTVTDWEAITDEVVQAEMANGNKIGAIKRYRELTGVGLKDAKDAIDYAMLHPDEAGDKKKKAAYDAQDAGIRDLILDGRLDEAIDIYQKFAGVDEYSARDAVEAIARELDQSSPPKDSRRSRS